MVLVEKGEGTRRQDHDNDPSDPKNRQRILYEYIERSVRLSNEKIGVVETIEMADLLKNTPVIH